MDARTDFHLTIDRAAGLCLDARCAARSAVVGPLPHQHRHLLRRAIVELDRAQLALFKLRNDPWSPPPKPAHRQLELL